METLLAHHRSCSTPGSVNTGMGDHIRIQLPVPVRKRIVYKLTVYRCLHGLALPYLAVDCMSVTSLPSRRHLRSTESGCLAVTGKMTTLGSRNFAVAGAKVWNNLPVDLRLLSRSLRTFGHKLKHYLFVSEP